MPVIYIDILFLINFILDSGLLFITGRLSGKTPHPLRILPGGAFGGIYSCSVFFVNLPFSSSFFIKLLAAAIMILITFYPFSKKEFARLLINFYIQTFLLGGMLSATFYFSGRPAVMSNNIYYFPFSTLQLFCLSIPLITLLAFHWKKSKNRLLSYGKYCTVTISHDGKSLITEGLIDSGCSLSDPLSGKPVIILNASLSEKIFDSTQTNLIKNHQLAELLINGFRLIPYSTVSSADGNMAGFTPDSCEININGRNFNCDCVIAFSHSFSGKNAIINPDVLIFGGNVNEL